jgi:hypothetical protein
MADEVDYYAVLGLPPSADDATIRLAYRRLARRYHPDIAGDENLHLMQALNQAYQTLSDPERRRLYDASRPPPIDNAEPSRATQQPPQQQQPHAHTQANRRPESVSASAGPLRRLAVFDDGQASAVVSVALAQGGAVVAVGHIDGQIALWNTTRDHPVARLALGTPGQAGTLSEVRISADTTLVMAWGFALGFAVWHVADGTRRWSSQMNAPSGLMDAVFLPHPAGLLRLALPDAPQALAESDPFYWADRGRGGTAIYTRPLPASGPIHPGWATPLRCYEAGRQKQPEGLPWQVRERMLSADGRRLLTFSTGRPEGRPRSQILRLWDIEARSHRGNVEPRRIAEVIEPDGRLLFPLAATPDLAVVALADFLGHMQLRSLDGRLRRTVATGPVPIDSFAALTSDATLLALAHGQRLDLRDTRTGQHLQSWQLTAPLTALTFAPAPHPVLALGLPNGLTEMWG